MRILQLIQKRQLRGAEVFAQQLSRQLETWGYSAKLLAIYPGNPELISCADSLRQSDAPAKWFWEDWRRLTKIVEEFQPDIVQCNAGDTLKLAVLCRSRFGWPVPIVARNASMVSSYLKQPAAKWLYRQLYRRVQGVASVSQTSLNDLYRTIGPISAVCRAIPVAIDDPAPCSLNWHPELAHLVHVGGMTFEKNHQGLLRIFNLVRLAYPEVHLHLVGDGPLRPAIEAQIDAAGLKQHVTLHGFQPRPLDYMAGAKAVLLPSIIEGLPAVLLEAMSIRIPVIASDVGGVSEIVRNGITGSLVPRNQEEAFAQAVLAVLRQPDPEVTTNAQRMVSENYSLSRVAQQFVDFYRDVIRG